MVGVCLVLATQLGFGQKVGVVLSGGGATAMAHIGFLKALEEEGIPIDYITGSSMGAIVGALYSAGYSVAEMDSMARSPEFQQMSEGVLDEQLQFYFKKRESDAGLITIKYGPGSYISQSLPTNLLNSVLFDYKLMELLSPASAAAGYEFDSLFVPFRCVASDVERKELRVFDRGNLNVAVRASATFPFVLKPIKVDGSLLFDGGLYDNFPSQLMYEEFLPDVILGCNVSDAIGSPTEDDLFSQLESMIRSKSNYDLLCETMIVVEPETTVGTFDFDKTGQAIADGYLATQLQLDSIRAAVTRRQYPEDVSALRALFRGKQKPLVISEIRIDGLERAQRNYVRTLMSPKSEHLSLEELKPAYFRAFADEGIESIFPVAMAVPGRDDYVLDLDVRREKDLFLTFGGNFSSRPINTGYIGLRYNLFGRSSTKLMANSYFGKYYGSVSGRVLFDISGRVPVQLETGFTFNRWDYFSSFATFFEEVRPSFIVLNERFGDLQVRLPVGNPGRLVFAGKGGRIFDDYYQTEMFSASDTADRTSFDVWIAEARYERSTLNRKQWASKGTHLEASFKWTSGEEQSIPGSTSALRDTTYLQHDWFTARLTYQNYFTRIGPVRLGFRAEALASTQDLFQNYVATVVNAPVFRPIPEARTFYLPQFHAHNYAAAGLQAVWLMGNVDLRTETYVFNPFGILRSDAQNQPFYDWAVDPKFISSTSVILHTPIGPASFSANYYDAKAEQWSFIFNFGYLIFNDSVRD